MASCWQPPWLTGGCACAAPVGLAVNGGRDHLACASAGENQRWDILRPWLLPIRASRPLGEFLSLVEKDIRPNTSLVLITPSLDESWFEALLPLVWRGVIPTVLLLDAASFAPGSDLTQPVESKPRGMPAHLANFGINSYWITRDLLDKAEARPGREGRWEWRVSPRGRAVAVNRPKDLDWKALS